MKLIFLAATAIFFFSDIFITDNTNVNQLSEAINFLTFVTPKTTLFYQQISIYPFYRYLFRVLILYRAIKNSEAKPSARQPTLRMRDKTSKKAYVTGRHRSVNVFQVAE